MKKKSLFILFFLFIIFNPLLNAEITGDAIYSNITGKATSQQIGLSIFVGIAGGVPSIDLISPKNNTYLKNESILLNFTIVNGDYIWYNIDDSENITITNSIYFNISQGFHILTIYSNNTNGTSSKEIGFSANSSKFIIFFQEYNGSTKGNSINFLEYTYEEIQSLERITLENTNYGKIRFNQAINSTDDKINTDNILDLDSNTQISQNNITLNSVELPNFNKPATIWLYNLGFNNPRILKDGAICSPPNCVKESYSGGTLKFNVTHFTTYSAEETPTTPDDEGGGSSGGGNNLPETEDEGTIEYSDIIVPTPTEIEISIKPGETKIEELYLTNYYDEELELIIQVENISNFLKVNETRFKLLPNETKRIALNFTIGELADPGNYLGKIKIITNKEIYEVLTSLDVQSVESLFDVALEIKNEESNLLPNGDLLFKLTAYNIGDKVSTNTTIKYIIKDINDNIIYEEEEIIFIENYFEKIKDIKLPKKMGPGKYILSVELKNKNKLAVASSTFEIKKKEIPLFVKITIPIASIIAIFFVLMLIGRREEKKRKRKLD